jgi:hypothetical protein
MGRSTNLGIGVLLIVVFAAGLTAQAAGTSWSVVFATIHGIAALGLLILSPWKTVIARRGLKRKNRKGRARSLILAGLVLLTITTGLIEMTGTTTNIGPFNTMQVHVVGALLLIPFVVGHYRRHPVRPRKSDLSRRSFLRGGALAAAAGIAWFGWERTAVAARWPGADRRFTGSHERSSFDPEGVPAYQWLDDRIQHLDAQTWRLEVGDVPFTYDELMAFEQETVTAELDCTSGWFSTQDWRGIPLARLIDPGDAASVEVRSATGYARRFPTTDLDRVWLALEVGGEPLRPGHGYPARIVAPDRRGFWWVKWVISIRPSSIPWWIQTPFPLT